MFFVYFSFLLVLELSLLTNDYQFGLDAGNKDYLNISLEECEQAVRRGNPFLQRQSKQVKLMAFGLMMCVSPEATKIRVDRLAPEFTLATIQALRIQHAEEIEKIKKIGEGSFSEVFHARYNRIDITTAVAALPFSSF